MTDLVCENPRATPENSGHHTVLVARAAQRFVDSYDSQDTYNVVNDLLGGLEKRWPQKNVESDWLISKACRNAASQPVHLAVWLDALETCLERPDELTLSLDLATLPRADDIAEKAWAGGDLRFFQVGAEQLAYKRCLYDTIVRSFNRVLCGQADVAPFKVDLWRESFEYFWETTQDYLALLERKGLHNCSQHERLLYENYRNAPDNVEAAFKATNATNTSSALIMLATEQRNATAPFTANTLFERVCSELRKHVGLLSGKRNVANPLIPSGDLRDPKYLVGNLAVSEHTGVQTWACPPFIKAGTRYAVDPPGDCAGWTLVRPPAHRRELVRYIRSATNNGVIDKRLPEDSIRVGEIQIFIAAWIMRKLWGERTPFV